MSEADFELQQYLKNSPDVTLDDGSDFGSKDVPQSKLAAKMMDFMDAGDVPEYVTELRFHPVRKWRFDFAWPDLMLALEVNGGTWIRGRHNRASSIWRDYEKINEAQILGWTVLQFTTDQVKDGSALETLIRAIKEKKNAQGTNDRPE
jgi:very-short-patch-repair endonuclease